MFRIIQGNLFWILVLKRTKVKTEKKLLMYWDGRQKFEYLENMLS